MIASDKNFSYLRAKKITALLKSQSMTIGLLAAVALGYFCSAAGASGGLLRTEITSGWAVKLIFFINGLALPTDKILPGLSRWRVHVFVQTHLFILTPLLALLLLALAGPRIDATTRIGIFYVAILPCTVSTAIVLAVKAGGNHPAALFNATLSNVAGVFIVPLLTGLALRSGAMQASGDFPYGAMLYKTASAILPPLFLGQIFRPFFRQIIDRLRYWLGEINSLLILFLVYVSFANATVDGAWSRLSGADFLTMVVVCASLSLASMLTAFAIIRLLRFDPPDAKTAFFCSTLKTLAAGVPMAQIIFSSTGIEEGLVLLPLLLTFFIQILLGSLVQGRMRESA